MAVTVNGDPSTGGNTPPPDHDRRQGVGRLGRKKDVGSPGSLYVDVKVSGDRESSRLLPHSKTYREVKGPVS